MKKPRIAVSAALTALISTGKRVLVYGAQKIGSDFNDTTISNNYRRQYGASSLVTVFIRVSCRVLFERRWPLWARVAVRPRRPSSPTAFFFFRFVIFCVLFRKHTSHAHGVTVFVTVVSVKLQNRATRKTRPIACTIFVIIIIIYQQRSRIEIRSVRESNYCEHCVRYTGTGLPAVCAHRCPRACNELPVAPRIGCSPPVTLPPPPLAVSPPPPAEWGRSGRGENPDPGRLWMTDRRLY